MTTVASSAEPDDTNNQISNRLSSIFPSVQVANKVIDIVTSNKPYGWGPKSNATYFKEYYAKEIKEYIDKMMVSREPIIYRYSLFCNENTGMSKQTLYTKVNQSIRYLCEKMDTPDGRYRKWLDQVDVWRDSERDGVVIEYPAGFARPELNDVMPKPEFIQPKEQMPRWRRELDEWLDSNSDLPYVQEHLALSPEEVKQIKIELAGLKGIQANVNGTSIKIIKYNES